MIISPSSNLSVFCNISSIVITNFTVTYANSLFEVKNSSNAIMSDPITLSAGNVYKFNQSESSNSGTTFKLFNSSNTEITSDIIKNGTPGTLNAYTMIKASSTISVYSNIRTPVIANVTGSTTTQNNVDGYKVIQFTTVGTYDVSFNKTLNIEVLVVAGGGGGGYQCGGGGGGGGVIYNNSYGVTSNTNITVTVGAGGTGYSDAANGGNSVCGTLTAIGGGRGGSSNGGQPLSTGKPGGSGGGSCFSIGLGSLQGGVGTTGQGFNGGSSYINKNTSYSDADTSYSGGGGGAGSAGGNADNTICGNGGVGASYSITGSPIIYGGGGGGGCARFSTTYGRGGLGGGGNGTNDSSTTTTAGTNGLGGGGGGGGFSAKNGANGGSGVVIIRYPVYA
jgi:hypothetical protein